MNYYRERCCDCCGLDDWPEKKFTVRDMMIYGNGPVVLVGNRGTGKTVFLRFKDGREICHACAQLLVALEGHFDDWFFDIINSPEARKFCATIRGNANLSRESQKKVKGGKYFPSAFVGKVLS